MQITLNLCHIGAVVALLSIISYTEAKKDERDCEVCIATLQKFKDSHDNAIIEDKAKSEKAFRAFCKKLPKGGKENKFCFFIGGTADAATSILGEISRPLSFHVPVDKICQKLKTDRQICELRFDKDVDFSKLSKLKVGELKKVLSKWGEDNACKGCAEKSDYVKKVKELLPKYEPEAYKKLQKNEL